MEIPFFNIGTFLPTDAKTSSTSASCTDGGGIQIVAQKPLVVKLENKKLHWARRMRQQPAWRALERALDAMGQQSADAQCLKRPVTSFERFADSSDEQALYLLLEVAGPVAANGAANDAAAAVNQEAESENSAAHSATNASSLLVGYLKIVRDRRLYLVNEAGKRFVCTPICVLDFFLHASVQHHGHGLELFNMMLQTENSTAAKCAYDKPSTAFLAFLQRHYSLHFPIWQPTAIVVFPSIFEDLAPEKPQQSRAAQAAALASDGGTNTADAVDDDAHDADGRPLTALERNRRSINQSYNGTTPPRVGSGRKAVALAQEMAQTHAQQDRAGDIIHGTGPAPARTLAAPDTPQGMKVSRDYGHQRIW